MMENRSKKEWKGGRSFTFSYKSHFTTWKLLKSEYYTCMNAHIHNKTISSSSWFFLVPYHHKTILLLLPTLWRHQYQLFCLIEQLTVSYIIISLLLRLLQCACTSGRGGRQSITNRSTNCKEGGYVLSIFCKLFIASGFSWIYAW